MKRDGVKTIIGLLIIGLIIVATFLYGNHQRQAQLRHDQDVKKQQLTVAEAKPQTTPVPQAVNQSQPGVPSPTANSIQGQGTKQTVTAPVTGGTALNSTPRTGAGDTATVALLAIAGAIVYYRRSLGELKTAMVKVKHD